MAEPPVAALAGFVESVGAVAAAARVWAGDVSDAVATETARSGGRSTTSTPTSPQSGPSGLGCSCRRTGVAHWAFVPFGVAATPALAPPLALWVRGWVSLPEATDRAVAVVGARAASGYGSHVAGEFGSRWRRPVRPSSLGPRLFHHQ